MPRPTLTSPPYLPYRVDWDYAKGGWRALARFALRDDAHAYAKLIRGEEKSQCVVRVVHNRVVLP